MYHFEFLLSNSYIRCSEIIVISNIFSGMVSKQFINRAILFNHAYCRHFVQNSIYLVSVLITLWSQMAREPSCAILKLTIAHTFRVWEFSSLPDQYGSIDIRAQCVLSWIFRMNHTEVSSHISMQCILSRTDLRWLREHSMHENYSSPMRFADFIAARNTNSF